VVGMQRRRADLYCAYGEPRCRDERGKGKKGVKSDYRFGEGGKEHHPSQAG